MNHSLEEKVFQARKLADFFPLVWATVSLGVLAATLCWPSWDPAAAPFIPQQQTFWE